MRSIILSTEYCGKVPLMGSIHQATVNINNSAFVYFIANFVALDGLLLPLDRTIGNVDLLALWCTRAIENTISLERLGSLLSVELQDTEALLTILLSILKRIA